MPERVLITSRVGKIGLLVDFRRKWMIVKTNTAKVEGIALEEIPGSEEYRPGMALIKQGWRDFYFLIEREGWSDIQYFDHAMTLLKARNAAK